MIRLFFGSPGSGKTTLACALVYKMQKKPKKYGYDRYFLNFSQSVGEKCDLTGLGEWTFPPHSYVIVDEAGIEYNNRSFKSLPKYTIAWLKLHRHYQVDVDFISQSWEDTDITIRRLADELWYLKRFGPLTFVRRVYKSVDIDKDTHQIIDAFTFGKLLKRFLPPPFGVKTWFFLWRPRYYKYFNTHDCSPLPVRYKKEDSSDG